MAEIEVPETVVDPVLMMVGLVGRCGALLLVVVSVFGSELIVTRRGPRSWKMEGKMSERLLAMVIWSLKNLVAFVKSRWLCLGLVNQ
jgi:hypothetical protein